MIFTSKQIQTNKQTLWWNGSQKSKANGWIICSIPRLLCPFYELQCLWDKLWLWSGTNLFDGRSGFCFMTCAGEEVWQLFVLIFSVLPRWCKMENKKCKEELLNSFYLNFVNSWLVALNNIFTNIVWICKYSKMYALTNRREYCPNM